MGPMGSGGRQPGSGGSGGNDAGVPENPDGSRDAVDAKSDRMGQDATTSVAFVAVQAIFAKSCVRCHDPAHPLVPESPTFIEMPLTPTTAYAALVNKPASETCGGMRVTPGDATRSYLYHKVSDATPCDGKRMPHPGMLANGPPLSDADIATIAAWINGGALP
jgi:mono/diheme cytochrome c family protein